EGLAGPPSIGGAPVWGTNMIPGWSTTEDFTDPRPNKIGPLPRDIARYKGLYINGERIIFSYTVAGTDILESPTFEIDGFVRTIRVDKSDRPLWVLVCDKKNAQDTLSVSVLGGEGLSINLGQRVSVRIPPHEKPISLKV